MSHEASTISVARYDLAKKQLCQGERRSERIETIVGGRLAQGRLPIAAAIIPGSDAEEDDWIEIEFGPADPAIAPFRQGSGEDGIAVR